MDWSALLIGLTLGILGNLLTPSVRHALAGTARWAGVQMNRLSEKSLRVRLVQLQDEYSLVTKYKDDPSQLIGLVMQSVMPVLFVTWVIIVMVFFISSSRSCSPEVPKYWYGAIGGMVGVGSRWFVSALVAWGVVDKVKGFAEFEKKNVVARQKIEVLLNR